MAVIRDDIDIAVKILDSKLSKETRSSLQCLKCGHREPDLGNGQAYEGNNRIQDAHIFPRRYLLTRWHPYNHIPLCWKCERWYSENESRGIEWAKEMIGDKKFSIINKLAELSIELNFIYKRSEHRISKNILDNILSI